MICMAKITGEFCDKNSLFTEKHDKISYGLETKEAWLFDIWLKNGQKNLIKNNCQIKNIYFTPIPTGRFYYLIVHKKAGTLTTYGKVTFEVRITDTLTKTLQSSEYHA